MNKNSMVLSHTGVYLFPTASQVTAQIDRELLVVFWLPVPKACGFVLFDPVEKKKNLIEELDTLLTKVTTSLDSANHPITVKAFGLSRHSATVLPMLLEWLRSKNLSLANKDLGRNVGRNINVECNSGRVGVKYAEAYFPGLPQFLSHGSARQRLGVSQNDSEVLVLSRNPVYRQLTLQATEEHRHWTCSIPTHPEDVWAGTDFPYFPWSWVLLFEDLESESGVADWIKGIAKAYPQVGFAWVGEKVPKKWEALTSWKLLHVPDPESIVAFKEQLAVLLASRDGGIDQSGYVIPFPRQKTKKTK